MSQDLLTTYNHHFVQNEIIKQIDTGIVSRYSFPKQNKYQNLYGNDIVIQEFFERNGELNMLPSTNSDIFVKNAVKTKTGFWLFYWNEKPPKSGLLILVDYEYFK